MVSFKLAFDTARKAGNKYFSWNGNNYNTMLEEEKESGNILDYLKLNSNTGNNTDFLKANKNLPFLMLGIFNNPTKGTYAGLDFNIGKTRPELVFHSNDYDEYPNVSPPAPIEAAAINSPLQYNRSLIRAAMRERGLDPYAYTGSQRKALRKALNSGLDFEAIFNEWNQNNLPISYNALGGLLKYLNGGTTKEQMLEAFKLWVALKIQNGEVQESDLKDLNKLELLFQIFTEEQKRGVLTAMNGAKLDYINQLNGKCPLGMHLSYYKIGGTLCKKCEADKHNENKDPIKAFKEKCGGKVKKHEIGGEVDDKNKKPQDKSKLVKKSLNKPMVKKPTPKPLNNRPGPKDLKSLPNGKYPSYWTPDLRGLWDRDHNEGV